MHAHHQLIRCWELLSRQFPTIETLYTIRSYVCQRKLFWRAIASGGLAARTQSHFQFFQQGLSTILLL